MGTLSYNTAKYNAPGPVPPEVTPNKKSIHTQRPDLTGTPDPTKTRAHIKVVGVNNVGGIAYGKATELYNKYRKYSEQCTPWHPFQSAHNIEQVQSGSQNTNVWIWHHLRGGLHQFKIESFRSADTAPKHLSGNNFRIAEDH
jgi:hypothetical protein